MLRRIVLKGFKSIKELDLELRPLNVLIGANGAGKSNLILFFKMLNEMTEGRLQQFIAASGRAHSFLHYGPKITPQLEATLEFARKRGLPRLYGMQLMYAAEDTLIFANGFREATVSDALLANHPTVKRTRALLNYFRVYHFHDTTVTARVRQYCYIGDNRSLASDAGNLAAVLLRLRNEHVAVYHRIIGTIRLLAPFFDEFALDPNGPSKTDITLNWHETGSEQIFGPHQLSDGTLRAMCLVTLLLQPEDELPGLIIVDEPDLGLHPYALNLIVSLFKKAAHHTQVLISTQSSSFLDNFDPEDIIVVDREGKESQFKRPDPAALAAWLEDYALGEVWEKNVIGGGPH